MTHEYATPYSKGEGGGHSLLFASANPVDEVWGPARPDAPAEKVRVHPLSLAGVSAAEKLAAVREKLGESEAQVMVVSALDEVCYLLNLRGADIAHNPVALSYVLVSADACTLFVEKAKLSDEVVSYLSENGVVVEVGRSLTHFGD